MNLQEIISLQSDFFNSGKTREISFRIDSLNRLLDGLDQHEERIIAALESDLGKPRVEGYLSEIYFLKQEIRLTVKSLAKWAKPTKAGAPFYHFPVRNEIRREPFGRALVIAPWNYPIQLSLAPVVSAISAGNCVVLKPSELAPASSQILKEIVSEAFEPGHAVVVEGDEKVSSDLLASSFDIIFFTGSTKVGKIVAQAAAQTLTPAILELGGKCPVVVDESTDLPKAAERITHAKFFNAGQMCFAPDFVVVKEEFKDRLAAEIKECARRFYSDNQSEDLANLISQRHYDRILSLVQGEVVEQIGEDNPETRQLAPRILSDVTWQSPVMQDEVFGPVLPILGYRDEDDLIAGLRSQSSPLAMYLFSEDRLFQERVMASIRSGSVCINDLLKQSTNLELPFGGVGGSGMGRYRGKYGFDAFTYQRPVSRRWLIKDIFEVQPPYKGKFEKLRKNLK